MNEAVCQCEPGVANLEAGVGVGGCQARAVVGADDVRAPVSGQNLDRLEALHAVLVGGDGPFVCVAALDRRLRSEEGCGKSEMATGEGGGLRKSGEGRDRCLPASRTRRAGCPWT
eukprot:7376347-Prymnesium_polylepis.1